MFPITRIQIDYIISEGDHTGIRMIQFWMKYLENQRNGIDSFIEVRTK